MDPCLETVAQIANLRRAVAEGTQAAVNFQLGDFALYGIEPRAARYVAGFGKAFNLRRDGFLKLALSAVAVDDGLDEDQD